MIIKVSLMVVASVAALKISQTKTSSSSKRNGTIKFQGNDVSHLEQKFEERENSTSNANVVIQNEEKQINFEMPQNVLAAEFKDLELLISGEKKHDVTENEVLQNLVQNYKQREVNLERKLLELNVLREEQSAIAQMKKQLEEKTERLEFLKMTIASLQSESKIIREKVREDFLSKKQLDIAKKMINDMQRKKDVNASPVKDHILMLQQQVAEFGKYNISGRNAMINEKFKDFQDKEVEVLELKRRNKEIELEKREMGIKLVTARAGIRSEEKAGTRIKEEIASLRHVHEELSEQVERLQGNRFDMVEELVYQRWLYTLLRFEVEDHQKQSRKNSRREHIQNSPEELCEKKHASSTSDHELESVSSNATLEESDEIETTTFESSSSSQSSSSSNNSMKMNRWKKTKDYFNEISPKARDFPSSPGLTRRFSNSMVASDASMPWNDSNSPIINLSQNVFSTSKLLESPVMPKIKRVSFSDSVKLSEHQDKSETVENAIEDKDSRSEQIVELSSGVVNSNNIDSIGENEGPKNNKIGHSDEVYSRNEPFSINDDSIKTILVQLVAFLFFLLILACFMFK